MFRSPAVSLAMMFAFGAALMPLAPQMASAEALKPVIVVPVLPKDIAGAYLAARQAAQSDDFAAAIVWFDRALAADPANPDLLEGAVMSNLAAGNVKAAADHARVLQKTGVKDQFAFIAILVDNANARNFDAILADQKAGNSIGALIDRLVVAWAEVGTGKMSEALADFDAIIATPGMEAFGRYHKALALAMTGDYEGADKLLSGPGADAITQLRRGAVARVEVLSQLERNTDAIALIDKTFGPRLDDGIADLRRRLVAGEPIAFDAARTANDGLAEVFFTLATALSDQADDTYTLIYARMAATLRPDHVEAQLMSARLLEKLLQFDLATTVYAAVPASDPAYISAVIGQAEATISAGRVDDAVALMRYLAKLKPASIDVQTALGDALHRQSHCDLAVAAYDAAIALLPADRPENWPLYYKRGNCKFVNGNWPGAEADYRQALKLDPAEPRVLNELGYGYVDRGEHLDEALQMIQQAVALSPDTGYIVDSLAWALYRLGRAKEAVVPMEKASLLMPVDSIVTDHLGDIYWAVGREREAQFQWHRALSFKPDESDKARIERKLAVGLDQVLIEEKATPKAPDTGTNGN